MFRDDDPCRVDCFLAEERSFHRHAFAVARSAAVIDRLNDQHSTVCSSPEAGFKRMLQRQIQLAKYQPVQLKSRHDALPLNSKKEIALF